MFGMCCKRVGSMVVVLVWGGMYENWELEN